MKPLPIIVASLVVGAFLGSTVSAQESEPLPEELVEHYKEAAGERLELRATVRSLEEDLGSLEEELETTEVGLFLTAARAGELEEQLDEKRARIAQLERPVNRPRPVSSTPTPTVPPPPQGGHCGGWAQVVAAHFPANQVARGCRILMCESRGDPSAANPSSSARGLMQILMSVHGPKFRARGWDPATDWADPHKNMAIAAEIWRNAGNSWSPWVC